MLDTLYSIDVSIFHFINSTAANPLFDLVMPALTDWNKSWIGLTIAGIFLLSLMIFGGKKGRITALLAILLIVCTDQLSSQLLKFLFVRPRPCHIPLEPLRLLVDCGSGYSFPSSHAVNNSAFAFFMSYHYRRWTWAYSIYGVLMCLSRVVVGVHYPSDVAGGAIIGVMLAGLLIALYNSLARRYAPLNPGTS